MAPPILLYANPQSAQPANSRLVVEYAADGIIISDPPKHKRSPKIFGTLFCILGLLIALVGLIVALRNQTFNIIVLGLLLVLLGVVFRIRATASALRPHTVRILHRMIYCLNVPTRAHFQGEIEPERIIITSNMIRLPGGEDHFQIRAELSPIQNFLLFSSLTQPEAMWLTAFINQQLHSNN